MDTGLSKICPQLSLSSELQGYWQTEHSSSPIFPLRLATVLLQTAREDARWAVRRAGERLLL